MSVAIRAITRLQDADDVNVTPAVGVDEYALCWDNDTARFVLRAVSAGVTDHGALTGLADDDHAGYALLAGRSGGQTLYGGTDANDGITIHGTSNATRTTSYVLLQPSGGYVGIGTTTPLAPFHTQSPTFPAGVLIRDVSNATGSPWGSLGVYARSADNATNGFGGSIIFGMMDNGQTGVTGAGWLCAISGVRDGADNTGAFTIRNYVSGTPTEQLRLSSSGRLGIGTASPATTLHALTTDTATNAVTNIATLGHNTSGTAAAGFGGGLAFNLQSSTTASQSAVLMTASWIVATHASRTARLALSAYDYNGAREGIRIDTDGSQALLGFYAHSAVAQQVLATGAGATADDIITALQALGLVKQS